MQLDIINVRKYSVWMIKNVDAWISPKQTGHCVAVGYLCSSVPDLQVACVIWSSDTETWIDMVEMCFISIYFLSFDVDFEVHVT